MFTKKKPKKARRKSLSEAWRRLLTGMPEDRIKEKKDGRSIIINKEEHATKINKVEL